MVPDAVLLMCQELLNIIEHTEHIIEHNTEHNRLTLPNIIIIIYFLFCFSINVFTTKLKVIFITMMPNIYCETTVRQAQC